MAFSDYLEDKLAKHSMGLEAYTMPTNTFLALFTADPTDAGDQSSEVTGGGYSRLSLSNKMEVVAGMIRNKEALVFSEATSDWGDITHVAIVDDYTGGNILYHGFIPTRTINTGDIFAILAYDFRITLD